MKSTKTTKRGASKAKGKSKAGLFMHIRLGQDRRDLLKKLCAATADSPECTPQHKVEWLIKNAHDVTFGDAK